MKKNWIILCIVLILILAGGYIYLKNHNQSKTTASLTESAPRIPNSLKQFSITAKQFEFTPSEIRVKFGDTVRIQLTTADVVHGFAIKEFNVDQEVDPGQTATVEFVADKKGTFTFYCSIPCGEGHREMRGTLIVE